MDFGSERRRPLRVLALHGGGYLGLASAAFVKEVERHFKATFHDRFDLFCGTSTGAILALGLAAGRSGDELVDLYQSLGPKVFPPGKRPGWFRRIWHGAYSATPLRDALDEAFKDLTLKSILESDKFAVVPAFCLSNGKPRIFKTDHHGDLSAHGRYRLADIALASAAAPTYFPMHTIPEPSHGTVEAFCDGGVFANDPSLIGYVEAIKYLDREPKDVSLLSISTPRAFLGSWNIPKNLNPGYLGWGERAVAVAIDGTADVSHFVLKSLVSKIGGRYECFRLPNVSLNGPAVKAIDDASAEATHALLQIGLQAARDVEERDRLKPFFEIQGG